MRVIREYEDGDLNAVLSAWENASRVAHPFLSAAFLAEERQNIPTVYLPNADSWVIEQAGEVVGFISLLGNEVGAIFVQPAFHGIGLGTALMDKAQELHGELEVEVFEKNSMGRQFYKKYGFAFMRKHFHEGTGHYLLRLKFTADMVSRSSPNWG